MIQITNANTEQSIYLKLEGYSAKATTETVTVVMTSQLTGKVQEFADITPTTTNGRYQELKVTPPAETDPATNAVMEEGLYLVTFYNTAKTTVFATRLAFVSNVPFFGEATYDAYQVGDNTAYNVYTQ